MSAYSIVGKKSLVEEIATEVGPQTIAGCMGMKPSGKDTWFVMARFPVSEEDMEMTVRVENRKEAALLRKVCKERCVSFSKTKR